MNVSGVGIGVWRLTSVISRVNLDCLCDCQTTVDFTIRLLCADGQPIGFQPVLVEMTGRYELVVVVPQDELRRNRALNQNYIAFTTRHEYRVGGRELFRGSGSGTECPRVPPRSREKERVRLTCSETDKSRAVYLSARENTKTYFRFRRRYRKKKKKKKTFCPRIDNTVRRLYLQPSCAQDSFYLILYEISSLGGV